MSFRRTRPLTPGFRRIARAFPIGKVGLGAFGRSLRWHLPESAQAGFRPVTSYNGNLAFITLEGLR